MNNGNGPTDEPGGDWQSPGDEPAPAQPEGSGAAAVPATAGAHPLANNNFDFAAFIDIVKLTGQRGLQGPVIKAFVAVSAIWLAWDLFAGMAATVGYLAGIAGLVSLATGLLGLLLIPLYFVTGAIQLALYRPMSRQMFEPNVDQGSIGDVLKSTTGNFVMALVAMLALTATVGLGMACCILPGIIAGFLFSQAPYLVVARDYGIIDAFTESFERTKRHWHVIAMTFGLWLGILVIAAIIGGPLTLIVNIAGGAWAPIAYMASPVVSWIIGILASIGGFVLFTAACVTIDELDGLETIEH